MAEDNVLENRISADLAADTAAFEAAFSRADKAVGDWAKRTEAAFARLNAANDKAAAAAQKFQAAINQSLGVRDEFGADKRAKDVEAYGRALDNLRARYSPLFAAQRQYKSELDNINRALQVGAINQTEYTAAVQRTKDAFANQVRQINGLAPGLAAGGAHFRRMGAAVQQAGFQVGDFAVQIASGQDALRAFIQQGTQILQFFGPWGAAIGAAGAIVGALAVSFLTLGEDTKEAEKAQKEYNDAIDDYIDLTSDAETASARVQERRILEVQGTIAQTMAQRELNIHLLEEQKLRLQRRQAATGEELANPELTGRIAALDSRIANERENNVFDQQRIDLLQLKGELDEYFKTVNDGLKRQGELTKELSEFQRDSAEAQTKAAKEAAEEAKKAAAERLKAAKQQQDELNRWLDGQQEALKAQGEQVKARTELERAQIAANDNLEDYIKKLEDAATVDGQNTTEKKVQQAIIEAQNKLYDKQGEKIRDLTEEEKRRIGAAVRQTEELEKQRKAAEQAARDLEKATDRAVENAADLFYDAFEGKIGSIGDLLKRTLKRSLAEGLAELARPIIKPVVAVIQQAGAAIFGGSAGSAAQSGGIGLGDLGFLTNFLPKGFTGGITSAIDGFGASVFGLSGGAASAAATQAAASTYGISAGQAATLANTGALSGGATLSGLLGAGGIGLGAGMLLRSFTDNKLISGGGGALAGAGAGFLMGGPIGAAVGGIAGLLGGIMGGGKSVGPVGHTNIWAQNGRLVVGSTGVDNGANAQATISQAQQLVEAVNRLADAYSLTITAGTTISQGRASGPQSPGAALQDLLGKGAISSSDPTLQTILARGGSAEELEANLQFGALYNSVAKLQRPANDLRDAFEQLAKQFDANIAKTRELGLSESAFRSGTVANFNQEIERSIRAITDPLGLAMDDYAEVEQARLDYAKKIGADIVDVERLNMLERQKIIQQSGMDIKAWLDGQLLGNTSPLTGSGRLTEAQKQFGAAVSAARAGTGGIGDVTRLGDIILGMSSELYGGTKQNALLVELVRSTIANLGKDLGYPGFAEGTTSAPAGWAWVGERGPELVKFRGGEQVVPAEQSAQMARSQAVSSALMADEMQSLRRSFDKLATTQATLLRDFQKILNKIAA